VTQKIVQLCLTLEQRCKKMYYSIPMIFKCPIIGVGPPFQRGVSMNVLVCRCYVRVKDSIKVRGRDRVRVKNEAR